MKNILCIHQGFELYGSDRTFVLSLKAIRKSYPRSKITVLLPKSGPLFSLLEKEQICDVIKIEEIAVLRKSDIKRFKIFALLNSLLRLRATIRNTKGYDLIYINSIVILDYILATRSHANTIVHIHEIPGKFATLVFRALLKFSKATCFFVSKAAKENFGLNKGVVILNGVEGYPYKEKSFGKPLKILHIGRINNFKGQDLLIQALGRIKEQVDFRLAIVGSVFGDQHYLIERLKQLVKKYKLNDVIQFHDFAVNPAKFYEWADVVVISSKRPESFGLVAVEAMSAGPIVLAARLGGLAEIFVHNESGLYFHANDVEDLGNKLLIIYNNKSLCSDISKKARMLFEQKFTEEKYIERFSESLKLQKRTK